MVGLSGRGNPPQHRQEKKKKDRRRKQHFSKNDTKPVPSSRPSLRLIQHSFFWGGFVLWLALQTWQLFGSAAFSLSMATSFQQQQSRLLLEQQEQEKRLLSAHLKTQQLWNQALRQQDEPGSSAYSSSTLRSMLGQWKSLHSDRSNQRLDSLDTMNEQFFSACLIVKDDNHWLIEWIAYHYHVLPLRHLVVVTDPHSHTSPLPIFDRWKDRMRIDVWTDEDFLPSWISKKANNMSSTGGLWMHLNRQKHFYGQCLQHLQKKGRKWVTLTDTDEFVRINPILHPLSSTTRSRSGHILSFLEGNVKQIQNKKDALQGEQAAKSICLLAPRLQLASIESNVTEKPPRAFSAKDLMTYRWLYHNGEEMPSGKNIIKLDQHDELPRAAGSVHHILESCPRNTPGESSLTDPAKLLLIQHYLGTLDQFTFRDDPRDAVDDRPLKWHSRGQFPPANIRDTGMTAWLHGFVKLHGAKTVQKLLQDAGQVEDNEHRNNTLVLHRAYNSTLIEEHMEQMKQGYVSTEPFSACLVTMDDSHWLIEWLAYHYHVLPLKRIIYVEDPHSRTSSNAIFARWRHRMDIAQWYDAQFIPKHILSKYQAGNITDSGMHRYRQKFFYAECLREFHRHNASWVLLTDTDEFVRPNQNVLNAKMPSASRPGAISRFLQSQLRANRVVSGAHKVPKKCLYIPRFQIAAKELDVENPGDPSAAKPKVINNTLGRGFDSEKFLTLRWRYHNGQEIVFGSHNLDGKNIIDVSQIDVSDIPKKISNVHHVLPDHCPASNGGKRVVDRGSWLLINHYLGTYEQFTFRQDPRDQIQGRAKRDYDLWSTLGQSPPPSVLDEAITPWLEGFVKSVGKGEARRLLKYVGETESNRTTIISSMAKHLGYKQ